MLFNSLTFLLGFVPLVFGGFFLLGKYRTSAAMMWLALASLVFYAWWLPSHTVVLLTSIVLNYLAGRLIARARAPGSNKAKHILIVAVALNLLALGYYKYAGFFVQTATTLLGRAWQVPNIVLPLGISFFTFTQLAYLVDTFQGKVKESNFARYLLFVTYFPHLIAGPVIHHKDVMPQFERPGAACWCSPNVAAGIAIFMLGLCKKVLIGDSLAPFVAPVFDAAGAGGAPSLLSAWGAALAYTFQLYFDFSGYSDMAIGLSLALNVRLPFNFDSPYKAQSIIDFWKRWHISLSTFLRDYLYIPLGGNRHGSTRRFVNLFLTMLIGGMWHGAGWTFIIWGGLHGVYLIVNHAWRRFREGLGFPVTHMERVAAWGLTFICVLVAWVFFRAHGFSEAWAIIRGICGVNGVGSFAMEGKNGQMFDYLPVFAASAVLMWIVVFMPNSQQLATRWLVHEQHFGLESRVPDAQAWRSPHWWAAVGMGIVTAASLVLISQPTEFLYFNF